jgi:hypothetical protein
MYFLLDMSKEDLADLANSDTPSAVKVPPTWSGILAWATIRYGLGIVMAAVFGLATRQVYDDLQKNQERLLSAYIENTVASNRNAEAINGLKEEIRRSTEIDKSQSDLLKQQTDAIERFQRHEKQEK